MKQFLHSHTSTFLSLLAKLQEGVIVHAQDTSITYANPAAVEILGLSQEELLGKTTTSHEWHFIDEDYRRLRVEEHPVNVLFKTQESLSNKLLGVYKNENELCWVDLNASITFNEKNEQIALVLLSDVTSRKEAYDKAELFQNLVNRTDVGVTLSDPSLADNPLIYINQAFSTLTGYSQEESLGKNCRYLQNEDTYQPELQELREAIKEQRSCSVTLKNYTKGGKLFYNSLQVTPYFKNDKLRYFIGIQHDISKLKIQEQNLKEQSIYIQSILNAQKNLVVVNDNGNSIAYANHALLDFFGFESLEAFKEKSSCICNFFLEDEKYFHLQMLDSKSNWIEYLLEQEESKRRVKMNSCDSQTRYFQIDIQKIVDKKYVITLNEITKTVQKEELLTTIAYHDNLTNALNRQYFYEIFLANDFDLNISYGVIMLDIDNFKSLNDTYGHKAGDLVLVSLAKKVVGALRQKDLFIRWGGEEFIVIVEVATSEQLFQIAQKLCNEVATITLENIRKFTASFGATLIEKNEVIDNAIQRADEALYQAKAEGKNRVILL